jgi:hypothetical protein
MSQRNKFIVKKKKPTTSPQRAHAQKHSTIHIVDVMQPLHTTIIVPLNIPTYLPKRGHSYLNLQNVSTNIISHILVVG